MAKRYLKSGGAPNGISAQTTFVLIIAIISRLVRSDNCLLVNRLGMLFLLQEHMNDVNRNDHANHTYLVLTQEA